MASRYLVLRRALVGDLVCFGAPRRPLFSASTTWESTRPCSKSLGSLVHGLALFCFAEGFCGGAIPGGPSLVPQPHGRSLNHVGGKYGLKPFNNVGSPDLREGTSARAPQSLPHASYQSRLSSKLMMGMVYEPRPTKQCECADIN
jgi:hypothetical protein